MDEFFRNYKIFIDGRWSLEDLYRFPRAYEQVYFTIEAMLPTQDENKEARLLRTFQAFPWQGGYSAVNFYNQLKAATPASDRPSVVSIQYASPGWLELYLQIPLAVKVAGSVATVAGSIGTCSKVYHGIWTDLHRRKLLGIEYEKKKNELTKDDIDLALYSFDALSKLMGIENIHSIHRRTRDPIDSVKILLSIFRRIRDLAEYQNKGKADFTRIEPPNDLFE